MVDAQKKYLIPYLHQEHIEALIELPLSLVVTMCGWGPKLRHLPGCGLRAASGQELKSSHRDEETQALL